MKFAHSFLLCLGLAAQTTFAVSSVPKQIVVSYPKGTPESVIESAMEAIKEAGGVITHEYSLIKGFAAKTTENIIDTISALGAEHNVLIEEDQMVGISGSS